MSFPIQLTNKIILALDEMSKDEALDIVDRLPELIWVKVGLELFTSCGPEIITILRNKEKKVFLDIKLHDIPNTMAKATFEAAKLGADLITVHACSGSNALKKAKEAATQGALKVNLKVPKLLAVTVLTSWKQKDYSNEIGCNLSIEERVQSYAKLAFDAGIDGCVCSPLEVKCLREKYPLPFELVTPGIRPLGVGLNDQARVMTPIQALASGASKLVVGRAITKSPDPLVEFKSLCDQLQKEGY